MRRRDGDDDRFEDARSRVAGPALALLIVAGLSAAAVALGLGVDVLLLAGGAAGNGPPPVGVPKQTQILVRMAWGVLLLASNAVTIVGAAQMRSLRGRGLAMTGCILACVPCFAPCLVLGIPFGIWGLVALSDPAVKRAFEPRRTGYDERPDDER